MEVVGLMALAAAFSVKRSCVEGWTVEASGWLAGTDFVDEVTDAVESSGRLIDIVAKVLERGGTGQDEIGVEARFDRAPDVGLHRVAYHDDLLRRGEVNVSEFAAGAVEHVAVWLAEVVGGFPGAGLEESRDGARARPGAFRPNRTPVIRIRDQEARAAFEALVGFGEFFEGDRAFPNDDVAWVDAVVRDPLFVQGGEKPAFPENEDRAVWMRFTKKIHRVQRGGVKMP